MRKNLAALVCGLIFGIGLTVSSMINPAKVHGFLDVLGNWDPSLLFVMGAGVVVTFIGYRLAFRRTGPIFGSEFPSFTAAIDGRLMAGAVLFGAGWGIGGYCPGPALAALTLGGPKTLIFVVAMLAGMGLHALWQRRLPATT